MPLSTLVVLRNVTTVAPEAQGAGAVIAPIFMIFFFLVLPAAVTGTLGLHVLWDKEINNKLCIFGYNPKGGS